MNVNKEMFMHNKNLKIIDDIKQTFKGGDASIVQEVVDGEESVLRNTKTNSLFMSNARQDEHNFVQP